MNRNHQLARYSVAYSVVNLAIVTSSNQHPFPDISVDVNSPAEYQEEQFLEVCIYGYFGFDSPYVKTLQKVIAENSVMTSTAGLPCIVTVEKDEKPVDNIVRVKIVSKE